MDARLLVNHVQTRSMEADAAAKVLECEVLGASTYNPMDWIGRQIWVSDKPEPSTKMVVESYRQLKECAATGDRDYVNIALALLVCHVGGLTLDSLKEKSDLLVQIKKVLTDA